MKKDINLILLLLITSTFIIIFTACNKTSEDFFDSEKRDFISLIKSFDEDIVNLLANEPDKIIAGYKKGKIGFILESEKKGRIFCLN